MTERETIPRWVTKCHTWPWNSTKKIKQWFCLFRHDSNSRTFFVPFVSYFVQNVILSREEENFIFAFKKSWILFWDGGRTGDWNVLQNYQAFQTSFKHAIIAKLFKLTLQTCSMIWLFVMNQWKKASLFL